jgi:hypothetical protein
LLFEGDRKELDGRCTLACVTLPVVVFDEEADEAEEAEEEEEAEAEEEGEEGRAAFPLGEREDRVEAATEEDEAAEVVLASSSSIS